MVRRRSTRGAHLFAADAQRFSDDLDEAAVAQTQLGAREVQAHLTAEVLSHQLSHKEANLLAGAARMHMNGTQGLKANLFLCV